MDPGSLVMLSDIALKAAVHAVRSFGAKIDSDEVQDVQQAVLLKMLEKFDDKRGDPKIFTAMLAQREVINLLRQRNIKRPALPCVDEEGLSVEAIDLVSDFGGRREPSQNPEEALMEAERFQLAMKAIASLSADDAGYLLRDLEYEHGDRTAAFGPGQNAAARKKHKILMQLRAAVKE